MRFAAPARERREQQPMVRSMRWRLRILCSAHRTGGLPALRAKVKRSGAEPPVFLCPALNTPDGTHPRSYFSMADEHKGDDWLLPCGIAWAREDETVRAPHRVPCARIGCSNSRDIDCGISDTDVRDGRWFCHQHLPCLGECCIAPRLGSGVFCGECVPGCKICEDPVLDVASSDGDVSVSLERAEPVFCVLHRSRCGFPDGCDVTDPRRAHDWRCDEHPICDQLGCNEDAQLAAGRWSRFCHKHWPFSCSASGCTNRTLYSGEYCGEHMATCEICPVGSLRDTGRWRCGDHKICARVGCENDAEYHERSALGGGPRPPIQYCRTHWPSVCCRPDCNEPALRSNELCPDHSQVCTTCGTARGMYEPWPGGVCPRCGRAPSAAAPSTVLAPVPAPPPPIFAAGPPVLSPPIFALDSTPTVLALDSTPPTSALS